jgi:chemotaxis protein methyltransferase CheR
LADVAAYRRYLEGHTAEWQVLDGLTHVTVSRFYRDRATWTALERQVLPSLAQTALDRGDRRLDAWSAGCASGEEPYTLRLLWELVLRPRFLALELAVLATDADEAMLERARKACYARSSLKELPADWCESAFIERDGRLCLRPEYRRAVNLARHDVRDSPPRGPFDLILCRNLAFTYFDDDLQRGVAAHLARVLRRGGALVVGTHESPPSAGLTPWPGARGVSRRVGGRSRPLDPP